MTAASSVEQQAAPRTGVWVVLAALAIAAVVGILWFQGAFSPKPRIAIVTASSGPYWDLILQGAKAAADRHGVRLDVKTASDEPTQSQIIRDLIGKGYDGVAISPNDGARQARTLAELGATTNLVTFDADSAISRRLCFVGTNNYDAGRMCGRYVREAVPGGGTVIIAIGSVDKENGQRRRQGLIDELLDRRYEPQRPMDAVDSALKGEKFTVLATLVDNFNEGRAVELAVDAIKSNPSVGCIVGLFARNTPAVLRALEQTGKLGQIKIVGFDANAETLDGVAKGYVHATIVQDAYNIGYQAIHILADASAGDPNAVPLYPTQYYECDEITKDNMAEMKEAMARRVKPARNSKHVSSATQPTTQSSDN